MSRAREIIEKYNKDGHYDHLIELDRLYPEVEIFGEQCISAEVRPGWVKLLIPCLEAMKAQGCKAGQIKQKFGGLRFYWGYPAHIEAAMDEWRKLPNELRGHWVDGPNGEKAQEFKYVTRPPFEEERKAIDAVVKPVVDEAERLSFRTCEDCGTDIGREGGPCCYTQCDVCNETRKTGPGRGRAAKHQE